MRPSFQLTPGWLLSASLTAACAPSIGEGTLQAPVDEPAGADGAADGGADGGTADSGSTDGGADGSSAAPSALRINELVAAGDPANRPAEGRLSDWIELANLSDEDIVLTGYLIADSDDLADAEPLPSLVVPARGYRLLWASGDAEAGPDHLGLRLDSDGERLSLWDPSGARIDRVQFGPQASGVSVGRVPDGGGLWRLSAEPSPGVAGPEGMAAEPEDGDDQHSRWDGCQVESDLTDGFFEEGDRVELRAACPAGAEATELRFVRGPSGSELDGGRFTWDTGPADGGRVELVWESRPEGWSGLPVAEVVSFWVADVAGVPGAVAPDPLTYTEEWALPVLHLSARRLSEEYSAATLGFLGEELPVSIKIRGASSTYYPKVSYLLDFNEQEIEMPGWGDSRNKLILTSTFDDNSGLRQKFAFDTWKAIADHDGLQRLTPRTSFVVVYFDGVYEGLYMACDRVDDELARQMGFADGGSMFKSVSHDANFGLTDAGGGEKGWLAAGWEKTEGEPIDDFSEIIDLTSLVGGAPLAEAYDAAVDVGGIDGLEFMDWSIFVAFASASDSAGKNAYLYADPDGSGLRFAPWDFNHSWGQDWTTARTSATDIPDHTWSNRIFASIYANPERKAELLARADALRAPGAPLHLDTLRAQLDAYTALTARSVARDEARWGEAYRRFERWSDYRSSMGDWQDAAGETAYLYDWIEARDAVFDDWNPVP